MMDDFSPARLADRAMIQDAMFRWCRAIDRLDWNAISEFFHEDAYDDHIVYKGDIAGLIAWLKERHKAIPISAHMVSNMLVEFTGPDSAFVETYVYTIQRYSADAGTTLAAITTTPEKEADDSRTDSFAIARYMDTFERREDGKWRCAKRVCVFDWVRTLEAPAGAFAMQPGWNVGIRNRDDPLYRFREDAGLVA